MTHPRFDYDVVGPGRGGQYPPSLSMAGPISASGEPNPKASAVSNRMRVLTDSTSALDTPWLKVAWVCLR